MDENNAQTELDAINARAGGWLDAFVHTPHFHKLTEVQQSEGVSVVRLFTECSYNYVGVAPERWSKESLIECCIEVLPRKITAEREFYETVAPILSAFFDFLADKRLLKHAANLSKCVAGLSEEIVAASQDNRNWGPAKFFA